MLARVCRIAVVSLLVLFLFGAESAQARYRYGNIASTERQGAFIFVEGILTNPRNTDAVVATMQSPTELVTVLPDWEDEVAGRIGVGYRWANGNALSGVYWSYTADQTASGSGPADGSTYFAIGPPIPTASGYIGNQGTPGSFDVQTELEAKTMDLLWSRRLDLGSDFVLDVSAGLRSASFEETLTGSYDQVDGFDPDSGALLADKRNESTMIGLRFAGRGVYNFTDRWSLSGSLGFSFLDGEIESHSTLTPTGTAGGVGVLPNTVAIKDDGRSGSIVDADIVLAWQSSSGTIRVYGGWEQSIWDGVVTDLVRNFPGTIAPLRERDSITFSGYKLGLGFRF